MKTIKLLLTVTAVAIVAIVTAVEKPKMDVIPLNADQAIVSVTNEKPALFEMSIETNKGDLIYYKQTTKASTEYIKTYDFANLQNGLYVLKLKVNDTRVLREFEVSNKKIIVGDSKMKYDPYFSFKDNILKFSYLNFEQEKFNVSIYNEDELFFNKKLGKDFAIQEGFNLSKLEKGNYKVILSSLSNEYVYSLEK
ncbi:MAG: hypothetical protein IPF54_25980 [Draconibacterium sp.]|nr:hypothetical protein [Draconibacterium sp.]